MAKEELKIYQAQMFSSEDEDLIAELEKPSKGWLPEVGDTLVGIVTSVSEAHNAEYGNYPLYEVDNGSEIIQVHAFHTVLKNALERKNVEAGDKVAVRYLGRDSDKRDMGLYRVAVKKNPTTRPTSVTKTEEPF